MKRRPEAENSAPASRECPGHEQRLAAHEARVARYYEAFPSHAPVGGLGGERDLSDEAIEAVADHFERVAWNLPAD